MRERIEIPLKLHCENGQKSIVEVGQGLNISRDLEDLCLFSVLLSPSHASRLRILFSDGGVFSLLASCGELSRQWHESATKSCRSTGSSSLPLKID